MSESVELTEAEHYALVQAVGWHCSHTGPVDLSLPDGCRECDEIVRVSIAESVALIVAAREATARREALLEAAEEVEAIENDALVAEVAAHVPGEVGRSAVIARRDEMYEDVAGWLRALAEPSQIEEPS